MCNINMGAGTHLRKMVFFLVTCVKLFNHFIQHTKTTELMQPHPQCSQVVALFLAIIAYTIDVTILLNFC